MAEDERRTLAQLVEGEHKFDPPSPLGGRDFAVLQTWMEQRNASRVLLSVDDDRTWLVEMTVNGLTWTELIDWTDCESHECPIFEGVLRITADVEAHERGELVRHEAPALHCRQPRRGPPSGRTPRR